MQLSQTYICEKQMHRGFLGKGLKFNANVYVVYTTSKKGSLSSNFLRIYNTHTQKFLQNTGMDYNKNHPWE